MVHQGKLHVFTQFRIVFREQHNNILGVLPVNGIRIGRNRDIVIIEIYRTCKGSIAMRKADLYSILISCP